MSEINFYQIKNNNDILLSLLISNIILSLILVLCTINICFDIEYIMKIIKKNSDYYSESEYDTDTDSEYRYVNDSEYNIQNEKYKENIDVNQTTIEKKSKLNKEKKNNDTYVEYEYPDITYEDIINDNNEFDESIDFDICSDDMDVINGL